MCVVVVVVVVSVCVCVCACACVCGRGVEDMEFVGAEALKKKHVEIPGVN